MYFCKFHYLSRMSVWGKTVQRSLLRAVPMAMCTLFSRTDKSRPVNYFFLFASCFSSLPQLALRKLKTIVHVIRSWTVLGMVVVNQIPGLKIPAH